MTKLVAAVVLVTSTAVLTQIQERPNYSGTWTLVEDRSPYGPRVLGNEFKVTQSATTVTIEATVIVDSASVTGGGNGMVSERRDVKVSTEYVSDGEEHQEVMSPLGGEAQMLGALTAGRPPVTYRATWLKGQLLIFKHSHQASENKALLGISRLALSFDDDGTLIVDSLSLAMRPRPNGPKQDPPQSIRSVYSKAQ